MSEGSQGQAPALGYDPERLPREKVRHYIYASEADIQAMLDEIGLSKLDDLFAHINEEIRFTEAVDIPEEMEYDDLVQHVFELSEKNNIPDHSFLGGELPQTRLLEIVPYVASLRELTTAYTPYQPERSQGTLMTHWVYQCAIAAITGFEAVNASMYDRSTALVEAVMTAARLKGKGKKTCLVCGSLPEADLRVMRTEARHTGIEIELVPCGSNGVTSPDAVKAQLEGREDVFGLVFAQSNRFGCLEDVDVLTDVAKANEVISIAAIELLMMGRGGFKAPSTFGAEGVDIFVAEGQHLAIGPNFGGPGLGIFGIRYNKDIKNHIRSTPGRFVGDAKDISGKDCKALVISTREQHIRREKATSNICTNQAFVATLVGAGLLQRGGEGLGELSRRVHELASKAARELSAIAGVSLAYPDRAFFHEFVVKIDSDWEKVAAKAREVQVHIGRSIELAGDGTGVLLSFGELHDESSVDALVQVFSVCGEKEASGAAIATPGESQLRTDEVSLPRVALDELKAFYQKLADQNISPDSSIYPLGSCTMKYNPYINDYAAALKGFTDIHPEAPAEDSQACLEILHEVQEWFKGILGLPAVTTMPVAGAQGELVGLKLFQAYHEDRGDKGRDIVIIPRSAHGTNPATATKAGFETKNRRGEIGGVVLVEADTNAEIDMGHLDELLESYGPRVAGIMVTNPNTSGIFETGFKQVAEKIHNVGGLVYMDGANMNAIAGWLDLGAMGVDAVHNNTHKTWSIPHGGGGPGDAIVGVSEKLIPYLPGIQVEKEDGLYREVVPEKSIGSFHRHYGNFGHKIRLYTYLRRLGKEGVRRMAAVAVLSARYLYHKLSSDIPVLPVGSEESPRMHEFILTLPKATFAKAEKAGVSRSEVIPRMGKLFLDFGFHAPTVAFPEVYGIMIEPTESYNKQELDRFADAVKAIYKMIEEHPEVLLTVPHFTPVDRVDDVSANRNLVFSETITNLPEIHANRISPRELVEKDISEIVDLILQAHANEHKVT